MTVTLTDAQAKRAQQNNGLWTQGGTKADPLLNGVFGTDYGFGALRCAVDNLNGDNVEWIGFPSQSTHVFCYYYAVTPPPSAGTIVVRKQLETGTNGPGAVPLRRQHLVHDHQRLHPDAAERHPAGVRVVRARGRRPLGLRGAADGRLPAGVADLRPDPTTESGRPRAGPSRMPRRSSSSVTARP